MKHTVIDIDPSVFQRWLESVFGNEVSRPPWYLQAGFQPFTNDQQLNLKCCTRFFLDSGAVVSKFSRAGFKQGCMYLIDLHGPLRFLADPQINVVVRVECISSMAELFKQVFTRDPLDQLCFIWFECLLGTSTPDLRTIAEDLTTAKETMKLLRAILLINDFECQRSSLHGLNHLALDYPTDVKAIIDTWLETNHDLDPKIVSYAKACSVGGAL